MMHGMVIIVLFLGMMRIKDEYPLAFATEPFSWSPDNERDIEIYLNDDDGCWGYIKENGESGAFYGDMFNREIKWNWCIIFTSME